MLDEILPLGLWSMYKSTVKTPFVVSITTDMLEIDVFNNSLASHLEV